uniref:Uncharacterized protein n=1 Tax=Anguilla anguilla TaxID=7936 RepID=A0A0E9XMH8_ANGAN
MDPSDTRTVHYGSVHTQGGQNLARIQRIFLLNIYSQIWECFFFSSFPLHKRRLVSSAIGKYERKKACAYLSNRSSEPTDMHSCAFSQKTTECSCVTVFF